MGLKTDSVHKSRTEAENEKHNGVLSWLILLLPIILGLIVFAWAIPDPKPEPGADMAVWSLEYVEKHVWDMKGGIGGFIGALFGFTAIAFAARLGFSNVITAQKHQAVLDRRARKEQTNEDRKNLAAGLYGELEAAIIIGRKGAKYMRMKAEGAKNRNEQTASIDKYNLPIPECIFFQANANKIGLFNAKLSTGVTLRYELLAAWRRSFESFPSEPLTNILEERADDIDEGIIDMEDLKKRLKAVEQGEPDPGRDPQLLIQLT